MAAKRKRVRVTRDPLSDIEDWLTPEEYESKYAKIATASAITRDVWNRTALGLEKIGAIRKVGKRFLIHRRLYTAYRLGELELRP
jgi:hypothetical protein